MELQVADYRYNTQAKPSELTGGIYRAIAPSKQVYKLTVSVHALVHDSGSSEGMGCRAKWAWTATVT
jgi:hypothetical protein